MKRKFFESDYQLNETMTLLDYLKKHSPLSGRSLRKYFYKGLVFRNDQKAHSETKLNFGDKIIVYAYTEYNDSLIPEPIPLNIVFENKDVLIINKQAMIAVHPSGDIISGTLANGVANYFKINNIKAKVRPVNRLDYGTSGLIIFAKNAITQMKISQAIREDCIDRIYYAVVKGVLPNQEGRIDLPIGENEAKRRVNAVGKPALTEYRVVKELKDSTLLEVNLKTGRTHQIRIHLSAINHPILGDPQYGVKTPLIHRPALHAGKLVFKNSQFKIPDLTANWPEDFQSLIVALAK